MKDKRQRIAIAWPYAAIYSDPTMAASILQACANSIAPYGYGHTPLIPQMPVMPSQMPPNHFASYGAYRYAPYPIPPPQRSNLPNVANPAYPMFNGSVAGANPANYGPLSIPKPPCTPPHDILQSPESQHSGLSLSPGSDKEHINKFDLSSSSNDNSPVKSLAPTPQGLLMTAPHSSPSSQTTIISSTPEKPKLFKPYKSEA